MTKDKSILIKNIYYMLSYAWLPSYAWITDVKKIDYLLWSKQTVIDEGENGF